MEIHKREEWLGSVPWDHTVNGRGAYYVCPKFLGWPKIKDAVIHYPGADWASMDFNRDGHISIEDTATIIRAMHADYLLGSRGYSLGYGFVVGQLGDIWEVRGWEYTNAANLGDKAHNHVGWNNYSISMNVIVDAQDPANDKQVAAINWLLDTLVSQKGGPLNLKYHGMGQSTDCCGSGVISQIKAGKIGFNKVTPPQPPTPIPPAPSTEADTYPQGSEKTMIPIDYGIAGTDTWWTEMAITPKGLQWSAPTSSGGNAQNAKIREIFVAVPLPRAPRLRDDFDVTNLMQTIGTFGPCPSTFASNPGLSSAWTANLNKGR